MAAEAAARTPVGFRARTLEATYLPIAIRTMISSSSNLHGKRERLGADGGIARPALLYIGRLRLRHA